ncbi:MAG TPA: hypothetical protein VFQ48_03635 [Pseudonocardiaceae bacterium]|nr:hypothetical protein [Pseudonocardiaceae bacterium]
MPRESAVLRRQIARTLDTPADRVWLATLSGGTGARPTVGSAREVPEGQIPQSHRHGSDHARRPCPAIPQVSAVDDQFQHPQGAMAGELAIPAVVHSGTAWLGARVRLG